MPHPSAKSASQAGKHRPIGDGVRSFRNRRAAGRFIIRFVLFMLIFYAITMLPWFQHQVFRGNLHASAAVAAGVLRVMGEQTRCEGLAILSPRFALEVRRGCEAIEPAALFIAAVLAFPASWRQRVFGIVIGVAVIYLLNLIRIITLYYAGVHVPAMFETLHLEVWQTFFIISTLALWLAWAWCASRTTMVAASSGSST